MRKKSDQKPRSKSRTKSKEAITRKEAIKKAGKYGIITAAATLVLLSPKKVLASSPADPWDW